jgi:hypothetical protein
VKRSTKAKRPSAPCDCTQSPHRGEKSLQILTAMQTEQRRLIVGNSRRPPRTDSPHVQWLRLCSSDANTAFAQPRCCRAVGPRQTLQNEWLSLDAVRCRRLTRGATDTTCTLVVGWLRSRFATEGTRPSAPGARRFAAHVSVRLSAGCDVATDGV